tara:strand:- start:1740 stop:2402 length:663 start_codon:yes stop_codon:yes gene_type:complete
MIQIYDLTGKNDLRFSPYCWRIKYLLNYKKIEYLTIPTTFSDRLNNPILSKHRLPTIIDDSTIMSESLNIAKYIENNNTTKNNKVLPSKYREAIYHFNFWADFNLNGSIIKRVIFDIYDNLNELDKEYFLTTRTKRFGATPYEYQKANLSNGHNDYETHCTFLNSILKDRNYIFGDKLSYADIIILGSLKWGEQVSQNTKIKNEFNELLLWKKRIESLCE